MSGKESYPLARAGGGLRSLRSEPAAKRSILEEMGVDPERLRRSGRVLADAATFVERAAHTLAPSSSTLERVVAAVTVAQLGARLIPAAGRLLRRHPVGSLLLAAGFVGAFYLLRPQGAAARLRPG